MIKKGTLQPIDLEKRFKWWDKVVPIFTKGEYPDGKKVSTQGCLPYEVQYVEGPAQKTSPRSRPSGRPACRPSTTRTRSGIRPDKVEKIETWADLLNPKFKGKTAIVSVPSIGIMDAAMALEARGDMKYCRQGRDDQGRDRQDHRAADQGEEGRSVPRVLEDLRRVGQPDGFRRNDRAVDVVAGGHGCALARHSVLLRAAQGRLSRLGELSRA
jgi:hypothetical protein